MILSRQDLEKITDLTLSHYNERAEEFWEGTRDHNVHQNIAALLQCIDGEPPFTILDFVLCSISFSVPRWRSPI